MPTITLKVPVEFIERLDAAAASAGQNRSEFIRQSVDMRVAPPVVRTELPIATRPLRRYEVVTFQKQNKK